MMLNAPILLIYLKNCELPDLWLFWNKFTISTARFWLYFHLKSIVVDPTSSIAINGGINLYLPVSYEIVNIFNDVVINKFTINYQTATVEVGSRFRENLLIDYYIRFLLKKYSSL